MARRRKRCQRKHLPGELVQLLPGPDRPLWVLLLFQLTYVTSPQVPAAAGRGVAG